MGFRKGNPLAEARTRVEAQKAERRRRSAERVDQEYEEFEKRMADQEPDEAAPCDPSFDEETTHVAEPSRKPGEMWHDAAAGRTYIADGDGEPLEITAAGGGALTGSSVAPIASSITGSSTSRRITSGTGPLASGGMITTTGGGSALPFIPHTTTTTTTPGWGTALTKKKNRFVRMPGRFTSKVLVGFLNPDEKDPSKDVEWAANLPLIDADISMRDGKMELVLTLSLEDIYGNNPEDEES